MTLVNFKYFRADWARALSLVALLALTPLVAAAATHLNPNRPSDLSWLGKLTPGLLANLASGDGDVDLIITFRGPEAATAGAAASAAGRRFVS